MEFRFIEFNDQDVDWLWMSKRDIAKNMMAFGRHPELVKAHAAYGGMNE